MYLASIICPCYDERLFIYFSIYPPVLDADSLTRVPRLRALSLLVACCFLGILP